MAVYLVYRSPYDDPAGKRLKRFEDDTVLDWFRNHWFDLAHDDTDDRLRALLGFDVYGLHSLFDRAAEHDLPPPEDDDELKEYLNEHLYSEGPILYEPHLLTVQTDDDELQVCYYLFDDVYLARHGKRAAYLLHEGWRLPAGHADSWFFEPDEPTEKWGPAGKGRGTTYIAINAYFDSGNLEDLGTADRIDGVRIPDLARYLCGLNPSRARGGLLLFARAQLLAAPLTDDPVEPGFRQALLDQPRDEASWNAYSDWLVEQGLRPAGLALLEQALKAVARCPFSYLPDAVWGGPLKSGSVPQVRAALKGVLDKHPPHSEFTPDPAKCHIQVEEHLAQLCLHTGSWDGVDLYQQWIFFDDLWAAAHPDLANGILRYQRCWDVLSPDGPHDEDE